MKKRIVAILLVFAMSTFLFACGNESTQPTEPTESTEQQATEEIPTTEIADSTEAEPIEEPTAEQEIAENTETEVPTAEQETAESTETEAPTSEPTEEATVQYTYTDLSTTMYAQQTVNVRNQPSTDGEKVGSLSTNQEVSVSGQCNETGWYRIVYGDGEAYVSNKYLGDNKVEVQQSAQNTQTSDNSGGGSTSSSNGYFYQNAYGQTLTMTYDDALAEASKKYTMLQLFDNGSNQIYFYCISCHFRDNPTFDEGIFLTTFNQASDILKQRGYLNITGDSERLEYIDNQNYSVTKWLLTAQ